jgi:hypothetical protein
MFPLWTTATDTAGGGGFFLESGSSRHPDKRIMAANVGADRRKMTLTGRVGILEILHSQGFLARSFDPVTN